MTPTDIADALRWLATTDAIPFLLGGALGLAMTRRPATPTQTDLMELHGLRQFRQKVIARVAPDATDWQCTDDFLMARIDDLDNVNEACFLMAEVERLKGAR